MNFAANLIYIRDDKRHGVDRINRLPSGRQTVFTVLSFLNVRKYPPSLDFLIAPPSMGSPSELFPADYGFPLWAVFAVWVVVLLLLYPACLWFVRLKQRRQDWWLTYL